VEQAPSIKENPFLKNDKKKIERDSQRAEHTSVKIEGAVQSIDDYKQKTTLIARKSIGLEYTI
jgi:hypothetical protein